MLLPQLNRFKLDTVAKALNISLDHHHRAVDDAACTAEIFVKFIEKLKDRGISSLDEVNALAKSSVEMIRKMPTYHAIILATCDQGVPISTGLSRCRTSSIIIRDREYQNQSLTSIVMGF